MVAYVNTELMAICHPDDEDMAKHFAEYLTMLILSQPQNTTSGAGW